MSQNLFLHLGKKFEAAGAHLVHVDGVVLGQHLLQGIRHTGELQRVWRPCRGYHSGIFCSSLTLDHTSRPNGDPANAPQPLEIGLVNIL